MIDTWDTTTLDDELRELLECDADLICEYHEAQQVGDGSESAFRTAMDRLKEDLKKHLLTRTVRAFHYTRITDAEAARMAQGGPRISTVAALRARLDALVSDGDISAGESDTIFEAGRKTIAPCEPWKFYMIWRPIDPNNGLIRPFLKAWGGEVAQNADLDRGLRARLTPLGAPREVEIALKVADAPHMADKLAEQLIAQYAHARNWAEAPTHVDLNVRKDLSGTAVLSIRDLDL